MEIRTIKQVEEDIKKLQQDYAKAYTGYHKKLCKLRKQRAALEAEIRFISKDYSYDVSL